MPEVKSNFIQRASKKSGRECSGFPRDEKQRVGVIASAGKRV